MDNQHRQIKGYRELSQAEIDLMNKIKTHASVTEELLTETVAQLRQDFNVYDDAGDEAGQKRMTDADAFRWASIARTHFQQGFMALTRAVAQPTTF